MLSYLPLANLGVGLDGGNDKDWEANACKIQLIKKKGKVKALDEEVHSNVLSLIFPILPFFGTHFKVDLKVEEKEEK